MTNRVCTICARGGSLGIKNKNLRILGDRPLIAHTIAHARETRLFQAIGVSSDSKEILEVAQSWGADVIIDRPAEMATDTASKLPAIRHAMLEIEKVQNTKIDVLVDLQATSPLREPLDIVGALELLQRCPEATNVITGSVAKCSPYFSLVEKSPSGTVHLSKPPATPIVRRQDAPPCFDMNGSIYAWRRHPFVDQPSIFYDYTLLYEMPPERSVDIDDQLDWDFVEFLLSRRTLGLKRPFGSTS